MRNYLILMIAIALVAAQGCGGKKSAGRTPDETAKLARSGGGSSATGESPGLSQGSRNQDDSSQKGSSGGDSSQAGDESSDSTSDDKSEDPSDDSQASDDKEAEEEASPPPPPARSGRLPGQRRRPQGSIGLGGGSQADQEKLKRDREAQEKAAKERESGSSNDNQANNNPNPPAGDVDEETTAVATNSFYDRAVKAFANRHDTEAFQFLYAHYLADENAFSDYPLAWFEGISEPRVALRWGVAIDYNSGGYDGDPPVIGDPVDSDSSSSGGSRGGGSGSDFGAPSNSRGGSMGVQGGGRRLGASGRIRGGTSAGGQQRGRDDQSRPPLEELDYYTGDFGEKLVRRYEMRRLHDEAYYGIVMKEIEEGSGSGDDSVGNPPPAQNNTPSSGSGASDGGGDFGTMGGGGGNTPTPPARPRGNRSPNQDDQGFEANETSLAPGLMFVGVGNKKQMLENAKNLNLDVLLIFEVKVKHTERRNGDASTKSNTRLVAYSVKSGEVLDTDSKSLSNLAVASAREKDREDPVELELDKLFSEMADVQLKAQDLPQLTAEVAARRYEFLLSQSYDNPLPVLVEIKQYLQEGLIPQNDYLAACEQLLGDTQAQDLIDGNMMKKEKALEDYLPGQYQVTLNVGGDEDEFR